MKLNKNNINDVINYVIEHQTFNLDEGNMNPIRLLTIVEDLSNMNKDREQEITSAVYRYINEGLVSSNYPQTIWGKGIIFDVTFRGFAWLEQNSGKN